MSAHNNGNLSYSSSTPLLLGPINQLGLQGPTYQFANNSEDTIPDPCSSNSLRETHMDLNVASEAKIDPPIQVSNVRLGGAAIRTFS